MTVQNLTKALEDATQMIHGYLSRISDLESQLIKEAARTADYKQRYEQISKQHTMLAKRYSEACND